MGVTQQSLLPGRVEIMLSLWLCEVPLCWPGGGWEVGEVSVDWIWNQLSGSNSTGGNSHDGVNVGECPCLCSACCLCKFGGLRIMLKHSAGFFFMGTELLFFFIFILYRRIVDLHNGSFRCIHSDLAICIHKQVTYRQTSSIPRVCS